MKFYTLALLIFLFSVSVGVIKEIDKENAFSGYSPTGQNDWVGEVKDEDYLNESYAPTAVSGSTDEETIFGDTRKGLSLFAKAVFHASIGFPFLLKSFGVPTGLAVLLSLPIYIIHIIALVQVIWRQPFGGMR